MNGARNGAVCGLNRPPKEVYRCVRDAPHCLIKQKVDPFKSNFAQGLEGEGSRVGEGLSKQAPGRERHSWPEPVPCMLSS